MRELHAYSHDQYHQPDVMLFTEARLHPDWIGTHRRWLENQLTVPRFSKYLYANNTGYGGVAAYLRHSVTHRAAHQSWQPRYRPANSKCWLRWFEVPHSVMVGVCYIPPEGSSHYSFETDRSWFQSNINYVASRRITVLCGDFNARHAEFGDASSTNARGVWLNDLMMPIQMECLNYTWLDGEYTHVPTNPSHSRSMIDLVFTNAAGIIHSIEILRDTILVSDHLPVHIILKSPQASLSGNHDIVTPRQIYNVHTATEEQWKQYSDSLQIAFNNYKQLLDSWDQNPKYTNNRQLFIDDAYQEFHTIISTAAELYVGIKRQSSTANDWWDNPNTDTNIPDLYVNLKELAKEMNDHPLDASCKHRFRSARVSFRNVVASAKLESWKSFCKKIEDPTHSKLLWNVWHQSLGSAKSPLNSIPDAHDVLPRSPLESLNNMAKALADISKLDPPTSTDAIINHTYVNDFVSVLRNVYARHDDIPSQDTLDEAFSIMEIMAAANKLRVNTSAGPDDIPPHLIKYGGNALYSALHVLFTYSWKYGLVPAAWRDANVCTIYKGSGCRTSATSYRPISITSVVVRFFERLILYRMWHVIEPHVPPGTNAANIPLHLQSRINGSQAGFRNGFSTLDHLLSFRMTLDTVYESGEELPVAFIDIAKAYDRAWKAAVLFKAYRMGITGHCWKWLDSYLHDRRMRVVSSQYHSDWYDVEEGLPQGSVLAPALFLVLINDSIGKRLDVHEQLFADDMMAHPLLSFRHDRSTYSSLQDVLNGYTFWADIWRIRFSESKSKIVWFSNRRKKLSRISFQLQGFEMEAVPQYTYLGVIFHESMNSELHENKILSTVRKTGYMINRLIHPHQLPTINVVRQLIRTMLIPQIAYSLPFIKCKKEYIRRLESAILEPARKVLYLPIHTPKLALLMELGIPSINDLRDGILCCMKSRTTNNSNAHNHYNTRMLQIYIPQAVEKVHQALSLYDNVDDGIAALKRERVSLSIVDEIAIAEHRLQLNSDAANDNKYIQDRVLESSFNALRNDAEQRGEVVASLKSSGRCSAYILHDGIHGARVRARLRLRRADINHHRSRHDIDRMPNCSYCGLTYHNNLLEFAPIEDNDHLLIYCPQFNELRVQLVHEMSSHDIDMELSVDNILCSDACLSSLPSHELRKTWLNITQKFLVSISNLRGGL